MSMSMYVPNKNWKKRGGKWKWKMSVKEIKL
jgi:hypothetical protein